MAEPCDVYTALAGAGTFTPVKEVTLLASDPLVLGADGTGHAVRPRAGMPDRHWLKLTGTTAAQQEEEPKSFSPAQMLKHHRSPCRSPAAYWSGGTGS